MRLIIHGLAALAVALPAGKGLHDRLASADTPEGATCRAEMVGEELTTSIEFPDGYRVEGPWKVLWSRQAELDGGEPGRLLGATLDRVVELDPTGERTVSPFPHPIETTFEGRDDDELVHHAAEVWCVVVLRAHDVPGAREAPTSPEPLRVAAVPMRSPA